MCLIVFAIESCEEFPLIFLSNRDEFYQRPSASMHWWNDRDVLAGKDLKAGGTWLAANSKKKFAAVTNYRDPLKNDPNAPSRGQIPLDILENEEVDFKLFVKKNKNYWSQMNGFNLLYFDGKKMYYYSNISKEIRILEKGVYGLSNAFLDTPWPKVILSQKLLTDILHPCRFEIEDLFKILQNDLIPEEAHLPNTGVGTLMEKMLAPVYISSPIYGTRTHTILLKDKKGDIKIYERQALTRENHEFLIR